MKRLLASATALLMAHCLSNTANATLIGNTVTATTAPAGFLVASPGAAVVGVGPEFSLTIASFPFADVDIDASSITIRANNSWGLGAGETITLSGLGGVSEIISGFSLSTFSTSGVDASDVSFTAHSITLDLDHGAGWPLGSSAVIELHLSAVPESASTLTLLGAGMIGLAALSLRRPALCRA